MFFINDVLEHDKIFQGRSYSNVGRNRTTSGLQVHKKPDIKHVRNDGTDYWSAKELAPILEYSKWEIFYKAIKRVMISCENSGRSIFDQFPEVRNLVEGGVAPRSKIDYELSRYACYLIVQM
ncbi:MAG: hypothetical protein K6F41_02550 [Lachnospira sp.]|nr:hypothetical protein [Lachnospira sp.]